MRPRALTIAGTDPTGGAGAARDLVTFESLGVRGACAITAVTVQDERGVHGWVPVPPQEVVAQVDAARRAGIDALKTGMLPDASVIEAVARALTPDDLLVVDPVLVATSGGSLASGDAPRAMREMLVPRAHVLTPNTAEAAALSGAAVESVADAERAGEELRALGARAVLVTGGHRAGDDVVDVLATAAGIHRFVSPRVDGVDTHGTGCALSAAICAGLARGLSIHDACARGIEHVGAWLAAGGWRAR